MAASMMAGCKHDGGLQGESGDLSALFVQKARIYIHSSTRARCARRFIARIFFRGCACKRHASACARTRRAGTACARAEWVLRLCHSVRDCARVCACVRSRAFAFLFVCLFVVCFTAPRPVVLCRTSRSGGVRFPASGRPEPIPRGMDGAREPLSWAQFG